MYYVPYRRYRFLIKLANCPIFAKIPNNIKFITHFRIMEQVIVKPLKLTPTKPTIFVIC